MGVRHDRRGKRSGGTAEEQTSWPDPRKRNGDKGRRRAKRGMARGIPKNQSDAEHSLAGNPSRNGEDTGTAIKDGTRGR